MDINDFIENEYYAQENVDDDDDDDDDDDRAVSSSDDDDEDITKALNSRGKVDISRIHGTNKIDLENNEEEEESEDEFEKEMNLEFNQRVRNATQGSSSSSSFHLGKDKNDDDNEESKKYDDVYFDSDNEEEEEGGGKKNVMSNDELLYDPKQDDEDQKWVDKVRRSYQRNEAIAKPLPNSDAVLNCPACFSVLCLDCQRHELYPHQYRAMFVVNCSVDETQKLKFPISKTSSKGKRRQKNLENEDDKLYRPVTCDSCSTRIAVYDEDEVYHFFNVVTSHS